MVKVTQDLGRYMVRLYLSWVLTAISGIAIVLALVSLLLDLDGLYEASEHALLLLLPVTGYQLGKVTGPSWRDLGSNAWRMCP